MTSSSRKSNRASSGRKTRSVAGKVQVKCSFCGNTFIASGDSAACPKCGRPANRDLSAPWRAISFFVPAIGLGYAAIIRSHSPVAARQGFLASFLGVVLYGGLYGLWSLF